MKHRRGPARQFSPEGCVALAVSVVSGGLWLWALGCGLALLWRLL